MNAVMLDARAGLRALRKRPGLTIILVAMLAMGIGISAAIFAVTDAALFKGFALVERNDRIVQIGTTRGFIYYPDFQEWQSRATSFEGVALVRGVFHAFGDDDDAPETYFTTEITTNTFRLLRVAPLLGRDFSSADGQPGAERVVILRYELWLRRFGASPAVIGRTVRIDGQPATIVGVMPRGFSFPASQDLWTPLVPTAAALKRETGYAQFAYARLRDGVTVARARGELEVIARQLAIEHPATNDGLTTLVRGFEEWFVGANARLLYTMLWGGAGFVLLVICANIANVLLEQSTSRSREIAIHLALGASRWRIIRPFVCEGIVLATLGGAIGWWLASAGVDLYLRAATGNNLILSISMDRRVLAYLIAATAAAMLVTTAGAATNLTRMNVNGTLADRNRGIAGAKHGTITSDVFIGVQVVLAVVLVTSAGVIGRSFLNVYSADVGVDAAHVVTMSLYAAPERYPSGEARAVFYRDLAARLQMLPAVTHAAFGTAAPTDYTPRVAYELEGDTIPDAGSRPMAAELVISPSYFQTLGVRLIAGRTFDSSDRAATLPVAIVNEQFVSRNWSGQTAVGKRVRFVIPGTSPQPWLTVVGVVTNVIQNDRTRQTFDPTVYIPYEQHPQPNMFGFVRTVGDRSDLVTAIRRQIHELDPNLPVPALGSLTARFDRASAFERNSTVLFAFFGVITTLIASLGLYATVMRSVTVRTREFGIRRAIGATTRDVAALVVARVTRVVAIGLFVGLGLSVALLRLVQTQLVGVSAADPLALTAAAVVFASAAALGCAVPAAHAAKVDPAVALRGD
jgi:putative ABC transport system permease protein